MNTQFVVDDQYFDSGEQALNHLNRLKDEKTFAVREVERTKVTRRTAKGDVITEVVLGSLEKVPRIISTEKLAPVFDVFIVGASYPLATFEGREGAEKNRSERQANADAQALLTEADIKEVQVPTLADILERDKKKIDELRTNILSARQSVELLLKKNTAPTQFAAELQNQIATLNNVVANLETQRYARAQFEIGAAKELQALELAEKASHAYYKSIHWDDFAEKASEQLSREHHCWPGDSCRGDDECTYEPEEDEIEEYLFDNADDFELDDFELESLL